MPLPGLRICLPFGRSSFNLAVFNHKWINTLFLFRVGTPSITIRLGIIMKRSSSVSLEIEEIILIIRRRHMRQVMLMMFLVRCGGWKSRCPLLCCALSSDSDAWRSLSWMLNRLFRLDYLKLPDWTHIWVDVWLMHSLRGLHEAKHLCLGDRPCFLKGCWIYCVLVIQIHVWLSTLRRFYGFAGSKYFIKKSILLLTAIRLAAFDLDRLLGASGIPFLVITDISIVLHHFIILILLVLNYSQLVVILREIMLLLLNLT